MVRKAVFPVAGYGTRMLPATKSIPKEMLTIINKPLIHYAVMEVIEAGIDQVIFITAQHKKSLDDYFDDNFELNQALKESGKYDIYEDMKRLTRDVNPIYVRQKEQLGLGHAVLQVKNIVGDEPFVLLLPDDIFKYKKSVTKQLVDQYNKHNKSVVALQEIPLEDTSKYGIVKVGEEEENGLFELTDMVEKPVQNPPSNMGIVGRYVLNPDIFEALEKVSVGHTGEIQITDAILKIARRDMVYGYLYEGMRFDCGTRAGLLGANMEFAKDQADLLEVMKNSMKGLI